MPSPYAWLLRLMRRFGPIVASPESKLGRGLAGRRSATAVLTAWGRDRRDPTRPVVWFHAPSVGEGLQARAVIEALRGVRPDVQVVYTFFSPSAEGLVARMPVEVGSYLPWDLPEEVTEVLDCVRPDLVVFTKTEVWPVLTERAAARRVPVGIVAASVPEGSGRASWPTRVLLRSTWRRLRVACANTEADAARLAGLGVPPHAIHTTGDPGIDSAAERAGESDPRAPHLAPFLATPRSTVVAGSTWPAGESVLLGALGRLRERGIQPRLVVAPHEPTESRVGSMLSRLGEGGWTATTLSAVQARGALDDFDAIVVDSVGVLAHLYTIADVAYVGGGFHDSGLHSVLEPAAARVPVVFGPRHRNARAAGDLLEAGGAKVASDVTEMERALSEWLGDAAARAAAGGRAFGYIDAHRGAALRTAHRLEVLIP